jgi:Cu(I)/Ag(I) efflux system membrane fusion protein
VPEAQSGPLQLGQTAQVRLAAFPGEVLAGAHREHPAGGQPRHTHGASAAELANPGQRLKAGMSGQITLKGNEQPALLVPSEAVIRTGKRALAYVVDGPGKFHPVEVQVGAEIGDQLVVNERAGGGTAGGGLGAVPDRFGGQPARRAARTVPVPPRLHQEHNAHGASSPSAAAANAFTVRGVIEEVSPTELTLAHEAVPALKWPAMTMGFKLAEPAARRGSFAPRQQVRFTFAKQGEDYVITAIERVKP